jgi:hypothetical protein
MIVVGLVATIFPLPGRWWLSLQKNGVGCGDVMAGTAGCSGVAKWPGIFHFSTFPQTYSHLPTICSNSPVAFASLRRL